MDADTVAYLRGATAPYKKALTVVEAIPYTAPAETATELDETADELAWQDRALCAQTDAEIFFPEKGGSTREAKKVCKLCFVRTNCLQYALDKDERFGIWGGMSERERRKLQRTAVAA